MRRKYTYLLKDRFDGRYATVETYRELEIGSFYKYFEVVKCQKTELVKIEA